MVPKRGHDELGESSEARNIRRIYPPTLDMALGDHPGYAYPQGSPSFCQTPRNLQGSIQSPPYYSGVHPGYLPSVEATIENHPGLIQTHSGDHSHFAMGSGTTTENHQASLKSPQGLIHGHPDFPTSSQAISENHLAYATSSQPTHANSSVSNVDLDELIQRHPDFSISPRAVSGGQSDYTRSHGTAPESSPNFAKNPQPAPETHSSLIQGQSEDHPELTSISNGPDIFTNDLISSPNHSVLSPEANFEGLQGDQSISTPYFQSQAMLNQRLPASIQSRLDPMNSTRVTPEQQSNSIRTPKRTNMTTLTTSALALPAPMPQSLTTSVTQQTSTATSSESPAIDMPSVTSGPGYTPFGATYHHTGASQAYVARTTNLCGLRIGNTPLEHVNINIPDNMSNVEKAELKSKWAAELQKQKDEVPALPRSQVAELPPKNHIGDPVPFPVDGTLEQQQQVTTWNDWLSTETQRVDRERNNQAAKKSRETRLEALRLTRNMLNLAAAERDWLRLKLIQLGGDPSEWDTMNQNLKSRVVEVVELRIQESDQKIAEIKKREEAKKRAERTRNKASAQRARATRNAQVQQVQQALQIQQGEHLQQALQEQQHVQQLQQVEQIRGAQDGAAVPYEQVQNAQDMSVAPYYHPAPEDVAYLSHMDWVGTP